MGRQDVWSRFKPKVAHLNSVWFVSIAFSSFSPLSILLLLLPQVGSEMAMFGQAVGVYFEEKLRQIFPGQDFPEVAEAEEAPSAKEKEEDTDDSDEDFVQPRRKRLKTDEKLLHFKWN